MEQPSEECRQLLLQAEVFEEKKDHYNAIKLCKRALKLEPEWLPPYLCLCRIYKDRREWKAVVHYNKKVVAKEPGRPANWWDLGIAAAATGRFRLAKRVWKKFGAHPSTRHPLPVQLTHNSMYELVWTRPIDPARVVLEGIPHPGSGRTYRDVLLIDNQPVGTTVIGNRRMPIYPELDLLKRSHYQTWSCILEEADTKDITVLEGLCRDAHVGMELWSNANRSMTLKGQKEYYANGWFDDLNEGGIILALAARREAQVHEVLRSWKVISLKNWRSLERHV